jgi:chemotaxis protein MotB
MVRNLFILLLPFMFFTSCVSSKKFKQLDALKNDMKMENQALLQKLDEQVKENAGLEATNKNLRDEVYALKQDTTDCHNDVRILSQKYNDLNKMYEELGSQSKKELTALIQQNQTLLKQLDEKQRLLTDKEIELKKREQRLQELEGMLAAKDAAINNLKKSIEDALLNFNKDDLTVTIRNGKIYVSVAEQLLFKSGSTVVDPKGKDALTKLAGALKNQPDIDIMVEGHTDSIPMNSGAIKDNWDLSVLRATSITRILISAGISPTAVIPAGHGEFMPVASNKDKDGRAKNRRTEIVLSPKLDEVFKILEGK